MKPILFNLLLPLTGLMMLSSFIWIRFIREKLPRNIPFQLSLTGCCILLLLCGTYFYLILKNFKTPPKKNYFQYFYPILSVILLPLQRFNDMLFNSKTIIFFLQKILLLLCKILQQTLIRKDNSFLYILLFILPKTIFSFCLVMDCFYLHKLYLIYNCIIIMTFPLIVAYMLFISERLQRNDTDILDKYFIVEITSKDINYEKDDYDEEGFLKENVPRYIFHPSDLNYYRFYENFEDINPYINLPKYNYLQTAKFIEYQADEIELKALPYEYYILFHNERLDTVTVKDIPRPSRMTKFDCKALLEIYINRKVLKTELSDAKNSYKQEYVGNDLQNIEIILNMIMLICWLFILMKSLHTLPENIILIKEYIIQLSTSMLPFSKRKGLDLIITLTIISVIQYLRIFYR